MRSHFVSRSLTFPVQSVTLATPFRNLINGYLSLTPTYRRNISRLNCWIAYKLSEARSARRARGSEAANMVDCVIDVVCLKEDDEDRLSESEMRDELLQCESQCGSDLRAS